LPATEVIDPALMAARLAEHAREAGKLALSMFQTPIKSWTKAGSSPVCDADVAVDGLLRERLSAEGSGVAWLSEESVDDPARLTARYVWIVDPIDGTRAYLAGLPDWTISTALVDSGRPIAACLYAPVTDELFVAAAGKGVTRNGVAIATSGGASLAQANIAGPKPLLERLAEISPPFSIMPRLPSLALRLARVAQGTFDAAIAGGNGGGPVIYNHPVPRHGALVAAGRDRHATLIDLLSDRRIASS
jgi:myo-inositol-1(or 4)-monophosphatase